MPNQIDVILGVVFIVLLLEATRRTTGWIVPVVAIAFMAYAYYGPYLSQPWTHRGFDIGQEGHVTVRPDPRAAGQVDLIGGGIPALMQVDSLGAKLKAVAPGADPIRTSRGSGYALAEDLPPHAA